MEALLVLAVKAIAGGTLVAVFALLGERLRPQSLAGILAAAPSIAIASLGVVLVTKGSSQVVDNTEGMLVGAAAMTIAALVAVDAVRRFRALRGSLVGIGAWLAAAGALYGVILR